MTAETITRTAIYCDNPACPGNELDAASYAGWTILTAQVYPTADGYPPGTLPAQELAPFAYCCPGCAEAIGAALEAHQGATK
jgi:hypothetical protein